MQLAYLGTVELRQNGVPITGLTSRKALALLCYLAVTGRPHLRPSLAGLLWGELPEASARNNLRKALTQLRQRVGSHVNITRQAVAFNRDSSYWLDVARFEVLVEKVSNNEVVVERLQEAVELYRGDFLEGFYVRQAPVFEEWVLAQQVRLRELALQALHALTIHYTRLGEVGLTPGITYATQLLALEPWREETHRQLMLLLARSGQRSAALAQYETCRRVLAEELSVQPGADTKALYMHIREGTLDQGEAAFFTPLLPRLPASLAPPPFLAAGPPQPGLTTPFVARKRELSQLDRYLDLALAGQGRVVFVSGEAGTGKTSLVQAFTGRAQERQTNLIVADGKCNAYTGVGDPYLPFREILRLLTGDIEAKWAAGTITRDHALRLWQLIPDAVELLVNTGPDLIDIFIPGRTLMSRASAAAANDANRLTPLQKLMAQKEGGPGRADVKQRDLFEQYTRVLEALAKAKPILLVLDDLQWADAGSINLLFHFGRRLEGCRILIIAIYRPADVALGRDGERHPLEPVINEFKRHFGQVHVNLRQTNDRDFVEDFLDTEPNRLGTEFRRALYRQTKGHALFTIEMLRGMQERGDLVRDETGRWVEGPAVDWKALPARVEGIIEERIGRLPIRLQEALKAASVEGETFTAEVVAQVTAVGQPESVRQLSGELDKQHRLVRCLGSRRLMPGGQRLSRYRFRHILFQKYTYSSLDEAERAYLHETIGRVLEGLYRRQTDEIAVHLARHFKKAGVAEKAVTYLYEAGQHAIRLSAHAEAVRHLRHGLELLDALPNSADRAKREFELQIALGVALIATKGFAAPDVGRVYRRARALSPQVGSPSQRFPVLWGLYSYHQVRAEYKIARKFGEQFLSLVKNAREPGLLALAYLNLGTTLFQLGEFAPAQEHFEQSLAHHDPQHSHPLASQLGQDHGLFCRCFGAHTLWQLGYPDRALAWIHKALARAEKLAQPYEMALALDYAAMLNQFRRERQVVREQTKMAAALCREQGFTYYLAWAQILQGSTQATTRPNVQGIAQMRQGLDALQATGAAVRTPYYLSLLAKAYGQAGQVKAGLTVLADALAVAEKVRERWWEAELYRLKGELLLGQDADAAEVERYIHKAINIARRQQAKSLELRAVMSLCKLRQAQGQKLRARRMLAEIYDWFGEGFDTADLKDAGAMLRELS